MSCASFCDNYYLPHMQNVYKRQTKRLQKQYPKLVIEKDSRILTKGRRDHCIYSFCNPSCKNKAKGFRQSYKMNRLASKKFKKFKKRGAVSMCDHTALF